MRVYVTGMGAVSCAGRGVGALDQALRSGASGVNAAGPGWLDLPPQALVGLARHAGPDALPRANALLEPALQEALAQAGLTEKLAHLPLYIGTAHGHLDLWQRGRRSGTSSSAQLWSFAPDYLAERAASVETTVISTACTASAVALGLALDAVRSGENGLAVVAGVEAMTGFLYSGFASLRSLAAACRPFDRERDGLVLGEGAAVLVLESDAHARQRGAARLAEVAGFGFGTDHTHLTAPDPAGAGASAALQAALDDAQLDQLPDHVNAHGTGTRLNDHMECVALRRVFQRDLPKIAISATKPITGHLCGAAGAIEVVGSILALRGGFVPPVLGLHQADRQFQDLDFVREQARPLRQRAVVSMNSGFGGTNTAVVLREVGDAGMAPARPVAH